MNSLTDNELYMEDIQYVASLDLPWDLMKDGSILLSGSTGLIGSFLIDVLMYRNRSCGMNCRIYALGRNEGRAEERFKDFFEDEIFRFIKQDINNSIDLSDIEGITYVLHLASNTHPLQYSTAPIDTVMTNIIGTKNMLDIADEHKAKRMLFASSNEVYGENRKDTELFDESYCGYIDSNTLRAGYPESKRCGEALCQAYIREKEMDVVISRFTRSYGPTMLKTDSKALSQFITRALEGNDIVLKSAGEQYYSYCYVTDAVSGLLTMLLKGVCGSAYNIADEKWDIRLKDLAKEIAGYVGKEVVFDIPDQTEAAGYSTATKARLDGTKLKNLGWEMKYDIRNGIRRTIDILKEVDWK